MKLQTVTVTGADDSVSPDELIGLSRRYPFVEWGILLSATQEGGPRFPSRRWLRDLNDAIIENSLEEQVNTSAHLCGRWLKDLLKGTNRCAHFDLEIFQRVQLNFHAQKQEVYQLKFLDALRPLMATGRKVIFQQDGVNSYILERTIASGLEAQALFDLSHGAGILPEKWPSPLNGIYCGYAGGIGPENIHEQLPIIERVAAGNPYWVDMETRVRSHNGEVFDLAKVRQCLHIAKEFMEMEHAPY